MQPQSITTQDRPSRLERRLDAVLAWAQRAIRTKAGYALLFLILFALAWIPIMLTLLGSGKSFIWEVDGLSQQYVWFVYTGQWIRELLSNIFVIHTFALPMWTMDAGYGTDVIQAYAGTFVNPLYWVSALVPERFAEFAFELVILAHAYLAGLTFSLWCRSKGCARSSTLVAAFAYVFAGNAVVMFSQPSFLVSMVTFPLILWGADRVFARRSPLPFLLVLTWEFASSFYDAYMICILLVLYCLVQFFSRVDAGRPRKGRLLRLLGWVGVFVGYVLLAMLASCVLLLPQVMALSGSGRLETSRSSGLTYALIFYEEFIANFISVNDMGKDAFTGVNAFAVISLVLLVKRRRENRWLLVSFIVLTLMMLLPIFGRLMNGFEYPANRWSWGYGLLVAYIIARMLPAAFAPSASECRAIVVVVAVYGALILGLPLPGTSLKFAMAFAILVAMVALVLCAARWGRSRFIAMLTCCVMLAGVNTFVGYLSPYHTSRASSLIGFGKNWSFHSTLAADALIDQAMASGTADYDETYRYDRTTPVASGQHNSGLITGHMLPDFYNSIYNQGIDDFNTSLGLVDTEGVNFRYGSLNSRAALEGLLGVRYYYLDETNASMLPETFLNGEVIAQGPSRERSAQLWQTDTVAPLAFVSSSYLTSDQYAALPLADRQMALLQGIVLDDEAAGAGLVNVGDGIETSSQTVPYTVHASDGVRVEENAFTARRAGATVTLSFDSPAQAEAYLQLTGLDYQDLPYRERYTDDEWEAIGFIERVKVMLATPFWSANTNGSISVLSGGSGSTINQMNNADHMYGGRHDWLVNLGYRQDGATELTLRFNSPGVYSFEEMAVVAQPMAGVDEQIERLAAAGAQDIVLGTNEISCTASSDTDAQLFLSVAYSDGWSATVDGQPATIHRADLGFMSVELPAGTHEVRLTYVTPYLVPGSVLSVAGIAGIVVTCLLLRRHRRRAA